MTDETGLPCRTQNRGHKSIGKTVIAPSDHSELVPAEIVEQEISGTDLISTCDRDTLGRGHKETDFFSLRFVAD